MKTLIFSLLSALLINTTFATTPTKPIICNQSYALCTSAPCIPDPKHPGVAICSCVVEKGDSAGYKSCAERAPKQDAFKTTLLISTFSFEQFNTKKSMTCAKGAPWTNCVDSPCTVDPMDATKAICSCPVNHTQSFFTFGGGCDTKTCTTGFWSGATIAAGTSLRNALFKKQNITTNPWPNNSCSINTK